MDGFQPPTLTQPQPLPAWGWVSQWSSTSSTTGMHTPTWSMLATSATTNATTGGTLYTFAGETGTTYAIVSGRAAQRVASGWAQPSPQGLVEAVPWCQQEIERAARAARRRDDIERFHEQQERLAARRASIERRMHVGDIQHPPELAVSRAIGLLRDEADKRARALLLSVLSAAQREQFERVPPDGGPPFFHVVSNLGNVFTLLRKRMHGVYKHAPSGARIEGWCVTPQGRIPIDDVLVMQKLALETDEAALRRQANVWALPSRQMVHTAEIQFRPSDPIPDYLQPALVG